MFGKYHRKEKMLNYSLPNRANITVNKGSTVAFYHHNNQTENLCRKEVARIIVSCETGIRHFEALDGDKSTTLPIRFSGKTVGHCRESLLTLKLHFQQVLNYMDNNHQCCCCCKCCCRCG